MRTIVMAAMCLVAISIQAQVMLVDKGEHRFYTTVGATFGEDVGAIVPQLGYVGSNVSLGVAYGRNFSTDKSKVTSHTVGFGGEVVGRISSKVGLGIASSFSFESGLRRGGEPVNSRNSKLSSTAFRIGPTLQFRANAGDLTMVPEISVGYRSSSITTNSSWGSDSLVDRGVYVSYGMQFRVKKFTTGVSLGYGGGFLGSMNLGVIL